MRRAISRPSDAISALVVFVFVLFEALLQWPKALGDEVITNVTSAVVSYQYPEDLSSQALSKGGTSSPIVSYQYFEWLGDSLTQSQSSPLVSFYFEEVALAHPLVVSSPMSQTGLAFAYSLPTDFGEFYVIEFKNALTDAFWSLLRVVTGDGQFKGFFEEIKDGIISKFYRVRSVTKQGFLSFPVDGAKPDSAPISAIMDHSGTPLDGRNTKWYKTNHVVAAFNGEEGQRHLGASCSDVDRQPGYKSSGKSDFLAGVLNYVGAFCSGLPADSEVNLNRKRYLNYDGHSGYDYAYRSPTVVHAPANGKLYKAVTDAVNGTNKSASAWDGWHTFYIDHGNKYSTWYLHCESLTADIEKAIQQTGFAKVSTGDPVATVGGYGGVPEHLHFEVRLGLDQVVDPYGESLWIQVMPTP